MNEQNDAPDTSATKSFGPANYVRGLIGAVVGGAIGYAIFAALYQRGFYAGILPGAILGLGCGYLSGGKSYVMGAICLVLGAILSVVGEWACAPFADDNSLSFFLQHIMELPKIKLMMLGAGTFASLWFGVGRKK